MAERFYVFINKKNIVPVRQVALGICERGVMNYNIYKRVV